MESWREGWCLAQRGQIDRQIDKDCDQIVVNCTCDSTQRYTKCVGGPAYLIYGMRALAPHCEYHKAQSCNKQNSLSMRAGAHKSTLGVLNRASIFVNHFVASVSDSVTDSTLLVGFSISSQYLVH